jgi:hypothetical protein
MRPFKTCNYDVYKSSQKYLDEKSEIGSELSELAWAYTSIGKTIPKTEQNSFSGHCFPWYESYDEIEVSYNLCMLGYYKQSMTSLRSSFELGFLSIYWNLNDYGHDAIKSWLRSQKNTPMFKDIWKKLEKHPNFFNYQEQHDIKQRLLDLGYLHDYVHGKGYKFSNRIHPFIFGQAFESIGFDKWFKAYKEVVEVLCILHLIKYPIGVVRFDYSTKFGVDIPDFGGLTEFEIDRLEKIIGHNAFQSIQAIAESDSTVQDLLSWIKSLPDLSEKQVEDQVIRIDKSMIKISGFNNWLSNQQLFLALLPDRDRKRHEQRIEHLRQWATENKIKF